MNTNGGRSSLNTGTWWRACLARPAGKVWNVIVLILFAETALPTHDLPLPREHPAPPRTVALLSAGPSVNLRWTMKTSTRDSSHTILTNAGQWGTVSSSVVHLSFSMAGRVCKCLYVQKNSIACSLASPCWWSSLCKPVCWWKWNSLGVAFVWMCPSVDITSICERNRISLTVLYAVPHWPGHCWAAVTHDTLARKRDRAAEAGINSDDSTDLWCNDPRCQPASNGWCQALEADSKAGRWLLLQSPSRTATHRLITDGGWRGQSRNNSARGRRWRCQRTETFLSSWRLGGLGER